MLITTLVISFCKDGGGSVNVKLWFIVVHVRCEDSADYHMGRPVLGLLLVGSWVQAGWISVRAAGFNTAVG